MNGYADWADSSVYFMSGNLTVPDVCCENVMHDMDRVCMILVGRIDFNS